jgi:integrase
VLSDGELRMIWAALPAAGVMEPVYKLLALTGQRRNEISDLMWDEIKDLDGTEPCIDLPASRTKNSLPHLIPLAPAAADIIREIKKSRRNGPFVFSTTDETPISGFSRIKKRLDKKIAELHAAAIAEAAANENRDEVDALRQMFVEGWRLHDLRRTLVTGLNERVVTGIDEKTGREKKGVSPHIVEAIVNHTTGAAKAGVAGVYNRALYLDERRAALNLWAEYIGHVTSPTTTDDSATVPKATAPNVVDFQTARAAKS